MLTCRARAAARLELDALGWSLRVSFNDRFFCGVSGFGCVTVLRLLVLFALSDGPFRLLHCPLRSQTLVVSRP